MSEVLLYFPAGEDVKTRPARSRNNKGCLDRGGCAFCFGGAAGLIVS